MSGGDSDGPSASLAALLADDNFDLEYTLNSMWAEEAVKLQKLPPGTENDYKNHNDLPLARIKRIMKSDEDVRMISAEVPVLFAKACELFILDLTLRSWACTVTEKTRRRTLQKEDIQAALQRTDYLDFLVSIICTSDS